MRRLALDLVSTFWSVFHRRRTFGRRPRSAAALVVALGSGVWALGVPVGSAHAVPVVYSFTTPFPDAINLGLSPSESVTFQYGFDTATPDLSASLALGLYELQSLSITLGGFTTTLTNPGPTQSAIVIAQDNAIDAYSVTTGLTGAVFSGLINGFQLQYARFSLSAGVTTSWTDDSLVLSTGVLNALGNRAVELTFVEGPLGSNVFSTGPYSVTVVPEPSMALLMALGLAALASRRGAR